MAAAAFRRLFTAVLVALAAPASAGDGWRTLTPPQPMPAPESSGQVDVNGASIYYALYGSGNAEAVLLLHGGLGAGEDFGGQIAALAGQYKVVAIDSRGHGRSTDDDQPYGYNLMAGDVMGVMDSLGIAKAAVVGWSDGGNIGLDMAINNPDRLTKLFALGANYQTTGVRPSVFNDTLIHAYVGHAAALYASISPTPDAFEAFSRQGVRDVEDPAGVLRRTARGHHDSDRDRRRRLRGGHRRGAHEEPGGPDPGGEAPADRQLQPLRPLAAGGGGEHRNPGVPGQ